MSDLKKIPHKLNDEDLLKIVEDVNNLEVIEKPVEHSVPQFLADFGIYPGTEKVTGNILYKLYHKHVEDPVSNVEFYLLMRGYLEHDKRYYYCNRKTLDLTKKLAELLQQKKYNKKVHSKHYREHFETFLKLHFIKPGTGKVRVSFLYFFYDKWQYNKKTGKKTKLSYSNFIAMIKLYFKTHRTEKIWCLVKIDTDEFYKQYTPEQIATAQAWAEKFSTANELSKKAAKKKKSSIKNTIPGAKTRTES